MGSSKKCKDGASAPQSLRIDGELSIYRAIELKEMLLAALERAPMLEVDLSGVTEIDTAGVQLLLLTSRMAQARQGELRLVAHSVAVQDALELLDLTSYLNGPLPTAPNPQILSEVRP